MPSAVEFQALKGVRDVLPPESARWERLVGAFGRLAELAAYGYVVTPIVEDLGVFVRGVGQSTDIVTKEMYEFEDKGGRRIALRPELTAGVVRAYIQHRPPVPWKVWYWGANFRYERPQAGRYRQFFQLGAEAIGTDDPGMDVEMVALAVDFLAEVGLRRVTLLLNSLGDGKCRPAYRDLLVEYLQTRAGVLCHEHRERWRENPLRVLDCKQPACLEATAGAPHQLDHLCPDCREHWEQVRAGLERLGVVYQLAPRLVRGLDYYTRTTFEFAAEALESAQNAVGGGGRYDGLVAALGGPETPGIGFSLGLDRLLLACDAEGVQAGADRGVDVFVVDVTGGSEALVVCRELRRAGLRSERAFDSRSMRSQMKAADRSGAVVAVIVGDEEKAAGRVTVRSLREPGDQVQMDRARLGETLRAMLSNLAGRQPSGPRAPGRKP